ncbi:unnamed protein product [Symbiodinium sp. KB8]|nr:unnamed protein product [Symbiodinium sp. KB8]
MLIAAGGPALLAAKDMNDRTPFDQVQAAIVLSVQLNGASADSSKGRRKARKVGSMKPGALKAALRDSPTLPEWLQSLLDALNPDGHPPPAAAAAGQGAAAPSVSPDG